MKLIIYDLDGTLVDTLQDITQAANHMLAQLGLPPKPAEEIRRYIGSGLHEMVHRCLQTNDTRYIQQGAKLYRAFYTQHLLDFSRLYPDAQAVLDYFKAHRQAVITNKPNPYSRQILEALGVASYFFRFIAGDEEFPKKPDPAAVQALMRAAGATPSETVFIGDSLIDIETGRQAGVVTVGIEHGFAENGELSSADLLVKNFSSLLEAAKKDRW